MANNKKFKKGAASFYIVAFSTLILLIVATSFAAIIISEITRTSNDDLAQSAYDSAMAGVEDAKLAYYNYQNCKIPPNNDSGSCKTIIDLVEKATNENKCDMVGNILDRTTEIQEYEETNVNGADKISNNMQQEHTCTMIQTKTRRIESNLNSVNSMRVYNIRFADVVGEDGTVKTSGKAIANMVQKVKVSWFSSKNLSAENNNVTYSNFDSNNVTFKSLVDSKAVPPTIAVAVVQTADDFTFDDFDKTVGNNTDRGMVYLVPTDGAKTPNEKSTFAAADNNEVPKSALAISNNKQATNLPYAINCPNTSVSEGGYLCSAMINLPLPVKGTDDSANISRNPETFMIAVSLPYGTPSTDFALEFLCSDGAVCSGGIDAVSNTEDNKQAVLDGVQIVIDSTGRANDLYRRVEVRLEEQSGSSFLSIMGPLELLGGNTGNDKYLLEKDYPVTSEYGL